jgi:integrase
MLKLAVQRKYISANPASEVKHFPELRDRPAKRGVTPEEFLRILQAAPLHLRVGMTVLDQTGNRTYSEVFSLKWEQIDLGAGLIYLGGPLKTAESAVPTPLSKLALEVLSWWKGQQEGIQSPYLFPTPKAKTSLFAA